MVTSSRECVEKVSSVTSGEREYHLNRAAVRDPKNLEQTLALCLSVDFIIDGTERRIQRPQDAIEQKEK